MVVSPHLPGQPSTRSTVGRRWRSPCWQRDNSPWLPTLADEDCYVQRANQGDFAGIQHEFPWSGHKRKDINPDKHRDQNQIDDGDQQDHLGHEEQFSPIDIADYAVVRGGHCHIGCGMALVAAEWASNASSDRSAHGITCNNSGD